MRLTKVSNSGRKTASIKKAGQGNPLWRLMFGLKLTCCSRIILRHTFEWLGFSVTLLIILHLWGNRGILGLPTHYMSLYDFTKI